MILTCNLSNQLQIPESANHNQTIQHSTRIKYPPAYLKDHTCNSCNDAPNHSPLGMKYPISQYMYYSNVSPSHSHYVMSLNNLTEPKTYVEANKFEC